MKTTPLKLIPATAILAAIAACFPISANSDLPRFWPFFYATGFALSLAHWFALACLCDILFSKKTLELLVVGSLAFFTLSLELALCFVAIKIRRILLLPTAIVIVIVPASVTAYCLVMGILGIIRGRRT
jgi:hypothetical protein